MYYATTDGKDSVEVVGETFNIERYGIAFPQDSPFLETINLAILELIESGRYELIETKYFGS